MRKRDGGDGSQKGGILMTRPEPQVAMQIRELVHATARDMRVLLRQCIQVPSISGAEAPFVRLIEQWAQQEGFITDAWEADESQLARPPWPMARHLPLAHRPTLMIRRPGRGTGRSLLFNAHADVVGPGEGQVWRFGPWSGQEHDGVIYGRGACDAKGPLVSALWAMAALRRAYPAGLAGDLLLELVPGEEDCVGLGTLSSLSRGYRADAAIVLEPTENLPRCASRGGCRFEVVVRGLAVHGTVKWLGRDAIQTMRAVLAAIGRLEQRWNTMDADPLFVSYPILRPITVDAVHGGRWQGMVCDLCICAGYIELLPEDCNDGFQERFTSELFAELGQSSGLSHSDVEVRFGEQYRGHLTPPEHDFCRVAEGTIRSQLPRGPRGSEFRWAGFNSGCEAGLRFAMQGTPTLVWGPGTLAEAHAPDESIRFEDVETAALLFATFCRRWMAGQEIGG